MREMTQADIERREAKDAAMYARRAKQALTRGRMLCYRWVAGEQLSDWEREVAREYRSSFYAGEQVRESWYWDALRRQAARAT